MVGSIYIWLRSKAFHILLIFAAAVHTGKFGYFKYEKRYEIQRITFDENDELSMSLNAKPFVLVPIPIISQ
jgi:hypothetical protein